MISSCKVLNGHVIVREREKQEKTDSGLFLAPQAMQQDTIISAQVVSVPVDSEVVQVGNTVMFDIRKSILLEDSGEKFRVLKLEDVVAVAEL